MFISACHVLVCVFAEYGTYVPTRWPLDHKHTNKNAHTPTKTAGSTADDPIGTATAMHEKTTKLSNHRAAFFTAKGGIDVVSISNIYIFCS